MEEMVRVRENITSVPDRAKTTWENVIDESDLKALIQPAYLARVASWLAFVVTIFMAHENGDNKDQPRDGASKACWLNKSL